MDRTTEDWRLPTMDMRSTADEVLAWMPAENRNAENQEQKILFLDSIIEITHIYYLLTPGQREMLYVELRDNDGYKLNDTPKSKWHRFFVESIFS